MDTVSVIIPVYNAAKYLPRCLDSVLNQTYSSLQVIVINDGSTDASLSILEAYSRSDARILIISQDNHGVSYARNIGLSHATGKYIQFVDADDWLEPNMVDHLVSLLDNHPNADFAICSSDHATSPAQATHRNIPIVEFWPSPMPAKEFLIRKKISGMLWDKLIRVSLFDGIKFNTALRIGEDMDVVWKLICRARSVVWTNQILYHYVMVPTSITNQSFSFKSYDLIKVWQQIEDETRSVAPQFYHLAATQLGFYSSHMLYKMYSEYLIDPTIESTLVQTIRKRSHVLFTSPSVSIKAKLFVVSILIFGKKTKKLFSRSR